MKKWLLACSVGILLGFVMTAQAETQSISKSSSTAMQASAAQTLLVASNVRIRLMPPGSDNTALYLTLKNKGKMPARLVGAEVFDTKDHKPLATEVLLHQTVTKGNTKKMEHIEGIDIAPGKRIFLRPGGHHIMLIGLKHSLKHGETYDIKLNFADKSTVFTTAKVKKISFKKKPELAAEWKKAERNVNALSHS